jgi:hypothetical protein
MIKGPTGKEKSNAETLRTPRSAERKEKAGPSPRRTIRGAKGAEGIGCRGLLSKSGRASRFPSKGGVNRVNKAPVLSKILVVLGAGAEEVDDSYEDHGANGSCGETVNETTAENSQLEEQPPAED